MKTRVQLKMSWTVTPSNPDAPFGKLEDFYAHARSALVTSFAHYGAELKITVKDDFDAMAILELVWDVNLDGVAGGYHNPDDHVAHARRLLKDGIPMFVYKLDIKPVLRHPQENDVDGATDLVPWDYEFRNRRFAALTAQHAA